MTSDELNKAIAEVCDDPEIFDAFGGKSIPYIGWYWRTVDFDNNHGEKYGFGLIPAGADDNVFPIVGFMENNKWGYPYVFVSPEVFSNIRKLLEIAVTDKTHASFKRANDAIQALALRGVEAR